VLNSEGDLIRAHKFVGKSGTKDEGDKGLTQVEQKSVRFGDFSHTVITPLTDLLYFR
jgi:hypothetical protein